MAILVNEFSFPIQIGQVLDFDVLLSSKLASKLASKSAANSASTSTPIGDDLVAAIEGHGQRQVLVIGQERWLISEPSPNHAPDDWRNPEFPHLRFLNNDQLLLVDTSPRLDSTPNAWIVDLKAQPIANFDLGTGVMDLVTFPKWIAAAYHPEAAFAQGFDQYPLAQGSINIYDHLGHFQFSVDSVLQEAGWRMDPAVCIAAHANDELLFIPETLYENDEPIEYPIASINLRTRRFRYWESPFLEPMAVSSMNSIGHGNNGGAIFLYSPEDYEDQLISYDLHSKRVTYLGNYPNIYRGLTKGRFISQLTSAIYAVVAAPQPETPALVDSELLLSR